MLPSNQFSLKFNTTRLVSVHDLAHTVNENGYIYQRSGLFDAPIRKEMVEGEIVDQHNHNSQRLSKKLRRMYEGKKGKFQQEGQQRTHDTRRVKA